MTKTMKAAILETYGAPFRTLRYPGAGARTWRGIWCASPPAASIRSIRRSMPASAQHARHPSPAILGMDLAGTVEAVGSAVTGFRPGDEVYGMTGGVGGLQGTLAEYAAVDADLLAVKPANLSMHEAAALPACGHYRLGGAG